MRPQTLALWLSAGVPCIAYIVTASGYAYWLDSGEFVAAAVQLDIAHPPGHPLSALYGKLLCLLPLGSLSFRVALGQGLASAAASALHCRANALALRGLQLDARVSWGCAVFGAWLSAFAYGIWFQAVRPEVYALQTLCVALVYERLLHIAAGGGTQALGTAAFALGLALTNHHLIALLLLPAFVPALLQVLHARRLRALGCALGLGALALTTYLYLPLRALHAPPANLGDPSSWSRFAWVVSARVYAHDMGSAAPEPLTARMLDVIGLWYEDLGWPVLLLGCLGLYLSLRLSVLRAAATVCVLVLLSDAAARAWLGPVRANPDILGYLAPSYLAIGTLAANCVGVLAWSVRSWMSRQALSFRLARRGLLLAPLTALSLVPGTWGRASLAAFTATDDLDELRIRRLPPRALVIESAPQSVFRSFELGAVEAARPDVLHVALPFLRYPGAVRALLSRHPELTTLVRSYQSDHDRLQRPAPLRTLSRERPVFVELDTRVDPALYPWLAARGVYAQVVAEPEPAAQTRAALTSYEAYLQARVGQQQHEAETSHQLLWINYMNAIQLGAIGRLPLARAQLAAALRLHPREQRLQALARALRSGGPLDPSSFLTF